MSVSEANAVGGEAVEVRRADTGVAGAAERVGPPLVHDDQQDVGLLEGWVRHLGSYVGRSGEITPKLCGVGVECERLTH
ncbi:MAG: hypothetical protein AAF711_02030 [Planctomycetota bacterium]